MIVNKILTNTIKSVKYKSEINKVMYFLRFLQKLGLFSLMLLLPITVSAQAFWDVPAHHKHHQAVSHLSDIGVISGYQDGSFQPDRTVSRAEAVKLLITSVKSKDLIQKIMDSYLKDGYPSPFFDSPLREWFGPYVAMARQYSIVGGYSDGSFRPHNTINFAEGLKIALETYGINVRSERFIHTPLLYMQGHEWFAPYFSYARNHNIINPDKFYHPAQLMTRGEFAEIIYRLKTIREDGLQKFQTTNRSFSDEYTITIPKLDIINVNVEFANPHDPDGALGVLKGGMGHYLAPPGSGHKMVLFGHSSGYNWDNSSYKHLLRQIDRLEPGDLIQVNYQEKGYVYRISNKDILPADQLNTVMKDYGYEEMALYTCWPPDGISHRYVVYAARI